MKPLSHLSAIVVKYDAFLLDLWGVVHDGTQLYPGVSDVLQRLRGAGKKIIFLSNASMRVHKVEALLARLGIASAWYDEVVTSGETGRRWLESSGSPWGKCYYYIGSDVSVDVLAGLDFERTESMAKANFLLTAGFGEETTTARFQGVLAAAAQYRVPMLCLNPDLEIVKITGERFLCPGALAADYQRMGGEVKFFGKPYPDVYRYCLARFTPTPQARVLAVGDGIVTDIAGAVTMGIDAMLVTGGILKGKTVEEAERLCKAQHAEPAYIIPQLVW